MKEWNEKQKRTFIKIQNNILAKMDISNAEVAEMFSTLKTKEDVFNLFQFQTPRWMTELNFEG